MFRHAVVAALGAALALAIGAAGAYFTTQVQVPENIIKAGTVAVSTEPTSSAISIDGIAPGMTVAKQMAVVNEGTLPLDTMLVSSKKSGIAEFYDALNVRVTSGGTELYVGPLALMRTTPIRLAPGSRANVQFEISLPSSAGNGLIGDYVKLSIYVDGEQAH